MFLPIPTPPPPPMPLPVPVPASVGGAIGSLVEDVVTGVNSVIDGIQVAVSGGAQAAEVVLQGTDGQAVNATVRGDFVSRKDFNTTVSAITKGLRDNGARDAKVAQRLENLERQFGGAAAGPTPAFVNGQWSTSSPIVGNAFGNAFGGFNSLPSSLAGMLALGQVSGLSFTTAQRRALYLLTQDKSWLFLG